MFDADIDWRVALAWAKAGDDVRKYSETRI
jgi:hypothetical protein